MMLCKHKAALLPALELKVRENRNLRVYEK